MPKLPPAEPWTRTTHRGRGDGVGPDDPDQGGIPEMLRCPRMVRGPTYGLSDPGASTWAAGRLAWRGCAGERARVEGAALDGLPTSWGGHSNRCGGRGLLG